MIANEAKRSRIIVNEIEEWLKAEYPDIVVEHLRDCGTRLFFFKDPEHEFRMISLIEIPVITESYTDESGVMKLTCYYDKVIFNAVKQEFNLDAFAIIRRNHPDIIKNYIEYCKNNNLAGIIEPRHKPISEEELIDGLKNELSNEIGHEIVCDIIRKIFNERKKKDKA